MSSVDAARRAAYEVLRRCFEHGAWADRAFPAAAERHELAGPDRGRAQWLAFGAVQRRGTVDAFTVRLTGRRFERLDPAVVAALRLALYELLFSERPADHAAVDDAVELAKGGMRRMGSRRAQAAGGLVNAVLRRAVAEREQLLASLDDEDPAAAAVCHSVPRWLVDLWWGELGADETRSLLASSNGPAETALRVNALRANPAAVRDGLERAGESIAAPPGDRSTVLLWPAEAVVIEGPLGETALAALEAGDAVAQSRAAQAVVGLLDPQPGERVLDLCAAPGLKTTAIAARMRGEGSVVAVERDAGRAAQLRELCERTGATNVRVIEADAAEHDHPEEYDRVLVDPPCSDLGTLRSHPDARWRKSPEAIGELAGLQPRILARGAAALRPGGVLVYSTCTISRRENENVAEAAPDRVATEHLGEAYPDLASPHDERFLQTRPDRDATDGFFYARFHRR